MKKEFNKYQILALIDQLRKPESADTPLTDGQIDALDRLSVAIANVLNGAEQQSNESGSGLVKWLTSEDVGASSLFLLSTLRPTMAAEVDYAHPYDLGDFSRCVKLLEAEPALRSDLHLVAATSQAWANLVSNFEMIETLLNVENPDWRVNYKRCKKTSELITKCINT